METIYKIKISSAPNTLGSYPSERRYSASTVFGLAIIYLALALFALICAALTFVLISQHFVDESAENKNNNRVNENVLNLENNEKNINVMSENLPFISNIAIASFLLFFGSTISSIGGFLASKRWYIDTNIKWFFMTSCFSILMSSIAFVLVTWTIVVIQHYLHLRKDISAGKPFYHIAIQVLIASFIGFLWSLISIKISYKGMNNPYRDDTYISNALTQIEYNNKVKGKQKFVMSPDLLNHFPTGRKLIKYLPKKENGDLPKEESNLEYEERVRKFLSTNTETIERNSINKNILKTENKQI